MRSIYKDFDNPPPELAEHGWQHEAVKKALYEIYNGKCAYSEVTLSFEEAEIDHYRPRKYYPQLENEWSNLLLVSKEVNDAKGANFNIQGKDAGRLLPAEVKAVSGKLLQERPLLLHTEVDRPENHLSFSKEGFIQSTTARGNYTITLCSLNSELLISNRKKLIVEINKELDQIKKNHLTHKDYSKTKESVFAVLKNIRTKSNRKQKFSLLSLNMLYSFKLLFLFEVDNRNENEGLNILIETAYDEFLRPPIMIKIKEDNSDKPVQLKDSGNKIPVALISHTVENYQRIRNLEIPALPINTQWIFLTGENGHGKTSLLQSIAISMYGLRGNNLSEDYSESFFHSFFLDDEYDEKFQENFVGVGFGFRQISSFAAYGTNRLSLADSFDLDNTKKFNKLESIFSFGEGKLQNIEEYLIRVHSKDKPRFNATTNILKELIDSLQEITIDESSTKGKVLYVEKDLENNAFQDIEFSKLATGYKSIIAMIGDMIIQLGDQASVITINGQETLDIEGIVIIDEIDAHLHPKYQKHFVATLTKLFPKVQFIASTHSPIPLLGAPYNTVILNVSRESAKEGIKVERLDDKIDFKRLTPEAILTSPIFGFRDIISDALGEDYKLLETESDYEKILHNNKLKERISKLSEEDLKILKDIMG